MIHSGTRGVDIEIRLCFTHNYLDRYEGKHEDGIWTYDKIRMARCYHSIVPMSRTVRAMVIQESSNALYENLLHRFIEYLIPCFTDPCLERKKKPPTLVPTNL